jgi:hypothetical protein
MLHHVMLHHVVMVHHHMMAMHHYMMVVHHHMMVVHFLFMHHRTGLRDHGRDGKGRNDKAGRNEFLQHQAFSCNGASSADAALKKRYIR